MADNPFRMLLGLGTAMVLSALIGIVYTLGRSDSPVSLRGGASAPVVVNTIDAGPGVASLVDVTRAPDVPVLIVEAIPSAYNDWRRTDYLDPDQARRVLARTTYEQRLTGPGADPSAASASASVFRNGSNAFVIYVEDSPARMPDGARRVEIGGRSFVDHAAGRGGIVDLETGDGAHRILIRGRATRGALGPIVDKVDFEALAAAR